MSANEPSRETCTLLQRTLVIIPKQTASSRHFTDNTVLFVTVAVAVLNYGVVRLRFFHSLGSLSLNVER